MLCPTVSVLCCCHVLCLLFWFSVQSVWLAGITTVSRLFGAIVSDDGVIKRRWSPYCTHVQVLRCCGIVRTDCWRCWDENYVCSGVHQRRRSIAGCCPGPPPVIWIGTQQQIITHSLWKTASSCLIYAPKWTSANFVDSWCPFGCSFRCVLLLHHIFLKTMYHSTIPLGFIWSVCSGK